MMQANLDEYGNILMAGQADIPPYGLDTVPGNLVGTVALFD